MRKLVLFLASIVAAPAATITLSRGPVSSTRAVIKYNHAGPCSYSASFPLFGQTFLPDTSALITSTNGDGSTNVEFGSGSAEATLPAGKSGSVIVTCGSDSGSLALSTAPVYMGLTWTEPPRSTRPSSAITTGLLSISKTRTRLSSTP